MNEHDNTKLLSALIEDYNIISIFFTTPINHQIANRISFYIEGKVSDFSIKSIYDNKLEIYVNHIEIKKLYEIGFDNEKIEAIPYRILDKEEFYYDKDDLGVSYYKEKSIFKVWSPIATSITLNIFDTIAGDNKKSFSLIELEKGIWSIEIDRDLKGKFYSYNVSGKLSLFNPDKEIVDPYAKCVIGNTNKALIIDLNDYNEKIDISNNFNIEDSIIYEIHIRDISIHKSSCVKNNGKYLALTEDNTYYTNNDKTIKTCLEHLKELGINTIQIMPIQDFDNNEDDDNSYNWGYMPKNYNTPDGVYSTNWQNDSKIKELKQLINKLHKEGFKVILDVVYNHTAEGFTKDSIYSFNGFVPYFYYRFSNNGHISNGSGCGNEIRTESPMVRKFIIDSLKFLTNFYGFDGYRFDLLGLIDLDTIKLIVKTLKQIKPDIFIYGEPWTAGFTPIQPTYKSAQKNNGFSVFNDDFRDAIKGGVFNKNDKGYIQTKGVYHYERILHGIMGSINSFTDSPIESINYIEVHDNNTLFDKLYFTQTERNDFIYPDENLIKEIKKLHKLAAFILLTSQGIPLLHLGIDFLRTKNGDDNSYNSGDIINQIDWNRKIEFYDVFTYYKNLIEIRKNHNLFKFKNKQDLLNSIEFINNIFPVECSHCIGYILKNGKIYNDSFEKILVFINPYPYNVNVLLKEKWKKLLVDDILYKEDNTEEIDNIFILPLLSGTILYK